MLKEKQNLYVHLNIVFSKILLDNPNILINIEQQNAVELFEDYSIQVKSNGYKFEKYNEFYRSKVYKDSNRQQTTLTIVNKINLGTDEEPQETNSTGYLPNLIEESYLYEWAGIGIHENYKILKALTLLSVIKSVFKLRFFGVKSWVDKTIIILLKDQLIVQLRWRITT
ncbi:unnamed protein product (macronuclear) [Paramecium tetraurelia]|uniref:Uncharacterized protein n=1 Tax=Paramecium tetraurelia TaxID=5888 RepID=A0BSB0_PARTE|nr:uncharacterized protein GSPATT00031658001 [Paramecium tetraurelia]CAK61427.1 unnamed protein product [Paramecium tetraurelia]|eukprot:XP_001428825.1 hypothetical protein (macronuclear) [Paramecium tetraurelia strain d4-2]